MDDDLTRVPLSGLMLRAEVQLDRATVHGEAAGAQDEVARIRAEIDRRRALGIWIEEPA